MANIKDLNRKIISLQNMQKVTRAMNLIASTRFHKLVSIQGSLDRFAFAMGKIAADMNDRLDKRAHPALGGYQDLKKSHVILFTSDKGLCGAHNNSVHRELAGFIEKHRQNEVDTELTSFGAKGINFCRRRGYRVVDTGLMNERVMNTEKLRGTASKIFSRFNTGEVQEVYLLFNRYISTLQQETVLEKVLPVTPPAPQNEEAGSSGRPEPDLRQGAGSGEAETEPGMESFIASAAELYLYYALSLALYNSYLSEYASRMTAMENATDNSEDLIDRYRTLQNRARQANITNEIIEIVSGKEAMKG